MKSLVFPKLKKCVFLYICFILRINSIDKCKNINSEMNKNALDFVNSEYASLPLSTAEENDYSGNKSGVGGGRTTLPPQF